MKQEDNFEEIMDKCYKEAPPILYKVLDNRPKAGNIYKLSQEELINLIIELDNELSDYSYKVNTIESILNGERVLEWDVWGATTK